GRYRIHGHTDPDGFEFDDWPERAAHHPIRDSAASFARRRGYKTHAWRQDVLQAKTTENLVLFVTDSDTVSNLRACRDTIRRAGHSGGQIDRRRHAAPPCAPARATGLRAGRGILLDRPQVHIIYRVYSSSTPIAP